MLVAPAGLQNNYWEEFNLEPDDIEFIYSILLDKETPLTPEELVTELVAERIKREEREAESQKLAGGEIYLPKENYEVGQTLVFPVFDWKKGEIIEKRQGNNPEFGEFGVIRVELENDEIKEFAVGIQEHLLNDPAVYQQSNMPEPDEILAKYKNHLVEKLEDGLRNNDDFVRIAGRWFPKALLINLNAGHLNLAEAILDMAGGGPLAPSNLADEIELNLDENPKLVEFSLDYALEQDVRFDEVGPAGEVLWFLHRLEPDEVRNTPMHLQYDAVDYDRDVLTDEMLALEADLDDELSPVNDESTDDLDEAEIKLIYPHYRAGTLPLTKRIQPFFPTAYEAPRIRFEFVDELTGDKFPAWVVREAGYVFGLGDWYKEHGFFPGSILHVKRGSKPGQVLIRTDNRRSSKEWLRTVLVGADGGVVFAMLKQITKTIYDERMAIAVPDQDAIDEVWLKMKDKSIPFEKTVVNIVRELTKLNPQSHVHVAELYAAVNLVRRCPPGPIMALLNSRPWFNHVGDLHFRFDDSEE